MEKLGDAIARIRRRQGYVRPAPEPNHLDPRDPLNLDVLELQNWPDTHDIEAKIAAAHDELDVLNPDSEMDVARIATLKHEIGIHETDLDMAKRRDSLAEGRPLNCWCLGTGGRQEMGTLGLSKEDPPSDSYWSVTCEHCDEGRAAAARRLIAEASNNTRLRLEVHALSLAEADVPDRYRRSTLENFPVSPQTEKAVASARAWSVSIADGTAEKRSVFLHGPLGSGKTSLGCALLGAWRQRTGGIGQFCTAPQLMDAIRSAREDKKSASGILDSVIKHPFVMLDDLGAELDTSWVAEKLMSVINGRHNNGQLTVITSNYSIPELAKKLAIEAADEMAAQRIAWRISEMCLVIHVNGPNLRDSEVITRYRRAE